MPTTKQGVQRLLEFFLYGMLRAAESTGTVGPFLRSLEEEGLRTFMPQSLPKFHAPRTALDACRAYTQELDRSGMIDTRDTTIRGDEDEIAVEIGERCPYRRVCTMRHDEGLPVHCIRAVALTEMLRIRLDADYTGALDGFGLPCRVRLTKTPWR